LSNVRSLVNKLGEFDSFLTSVNPDIFILTETWLKTTMPSSLFANCQSYHICRKDRLLRGGGICLLLKKIPGINVCKVELSDDYKELEIVVVDISDDSSTLPFRLVVVYRPPCYTSRDNAQLFSALSHLADDCVRICCWRFQFAVF